MKGSHVRWSIGLCALVGWLSAAAQATGADKSTIKDIGAIAVSGTVESINNNGQSVGAIPVSQTRNTGWWFDGKKSSTLEIAVEFAAGPWTSMAKARL